MESRIATFSGLKSSNLLHFARVLSTTPTFSRLRNFTSSSSLLPTSTKGNCNENHTGQQQRHYTTNVSSITCKDLSKKPHQDFSCKVAKNILQERLSRTPRENVLCSPVSTTALLNMLVPGSKGQTFDQFLDILAVRKEEKLDKSALRLLDTVRPCMIGNGPKITVTNGVWVDQQYPLTESYEGQLRNIHKADVKTVDFQNKADEVMEEVNQWAKTKTKGLIKSILPDISYYNDTVMILANTLHFKLESSEETFNPKEARHQLYYSGNFEGSEVLRIPYTDVKSVTGQDDRRFSMYIFAPLEKDGLLPFIEGMKLDAKTFKKQFKRQDEEISEIFVPKFSLESELPLSSVMKDLGLTLPFKAGQSELMRFVDSPLADLLYVTDITQKSRIETNEGGTTLAVSTYATLCGPAHRLAASPSKRKFVADNPFVFMIKEDSSGDVVTVGTMLNSSLSG